ncbi:partial putative peptide zinc metalloprotease protein, partial [biofilm metagenome]
MAIAQANPNSQGMAELVVEGSTTKEPPWVTIRDDLVLMPGPRAFDGSPTWTLYDPAVHKYFRIGWLEFECLQRWNLANATKIASAIEDETPLNASESDIGEFIQFLVKNQLIKPLGKESSNRFASLHHASKPGFWTWLLHNYLFLRIPLVKPDRWLQKLLPFIDLFFYRRFIALLLLGAGVALYLVAQRWSEFSHSFLNTFTPEGMIATLAMMSLSKVIHELGHAFAASHYGCRVPTMGVALLLGMPVLWTDVTDAWRLTKRKERLIIDAAGMTAELTLAVLATFLWVTLPDGPVRSGSYLLASTAWLITLGINLNPFMRFDGYYLLADAFDIPNLQDRSFALARWRLRESLFDFGFPTPEHWEKSKGRWLIIYAYSVWIYRLILFIGIAWLVYYFFFKALGLFLFAVEIGWFIIKPIATEIATWRKLIKDKNISISPRPSWLIIAALLTLLFIPWQSHLIVPGLLKSDAEYTLYLIEPAQVKEVNVQEGDGVKANQVLARLESPDVDYKILAARLKLKELTERLSSHSLQSDLVRTNPIEYEQYQSIKAELSGHLDIKNKLIIKATFDGRVKDLADELRTGEWIAKDEPLGIVKSGKTAVIGFVEEADLPKLSIGGIGKF